MCKGCYIEAGEPKIVNDKVLFAVELIRAVYEIHAAGGNLHIVLDDWNTNMVEACKQFIDAETDEEKQAVELNCYNLLVTLTEDEVITALAIYDGFFTPPSRY